MKKSLVICWFSVMISLLPFSLLAGTATVEWRPNPDPDVRQYRVYFGSASRRYGPPIPVNTATTYTFNNLKEGITHYFAITAVDQSGNESGFSAEVSKQVPAAAPTPVPQLEAGEASVNHEWLRIGFKKVYTDPVVVAASLSHNGKQPSVVRVRNIGPAGFEARVQEWDYLNGTHTFESIGYLVMERGVYALPNGTRLEAGSFSAGNTGEFRSFQFNQSFSTVPVIVPSISSVVGPAAVTCRLRNISTNSFEFMLQEQEASRQAHKTETISYVAWEPSSGSVGGIAFEVDRTGKDVRGQSFTAISFNETHSNPVVFLAALQSTEGADTAALRWTNKSGQGVEVMVQEDKSRDLETGHKPEAVGYLVLSTGTPMVANQ